jgi:hypothetical protein
MAWYLVVLNSLSAVIVLGAIVGSHLWAITQDRDQLGSRRATAKLGASRDLGPAKQLVPEPATS